MKQLSKIVKSSALLIVSLLPCVILAGPTTIRIDASQMGAPTVQILNSENYNMYVGPEVNIASLEWGGLIDLLGVDNYYSGSVITDREWRFTDPKASDPTHAAVFILWIDHDYGDPDNGYYGPLFTGDLRIGFNEHKPGTGYYRTVNASPIQTKWITLYSDANLVLQFKGFLPNPGQ